MSETEVKKVGGSKKKKVIMILCIVLILIVALFACQVAMNAGTPEIAENFPVNVRVASAELMSLHSTAPISGRIQPIEEVTIMPLATGEVTRVNVRMGDWVARGATLFHIDQTQAAASLNQAQAGLSQAQAGLNQANETLNSHRTTFERTQLLYNEGAVSLQAFEQARTQYLTARESVNSASASVNMARATVTSASNAAGNSNVTAPISGYVTSLNVSVGSIASPGAPAATIADVSSLEINTSVSEYLAFRLSAGTPVEIRVAALGDRVHSGTIAAVSPAPAAGGLTFPVRISVDNENGELMAGMFAEISLIADERDQVIAIPSDAVIMRTGRTLVVVLGSDNIPEFRDITVGIDNGEYAEITSGLSVGETIVITGQHFVNEGTAVNIVE